MKKTKNAQCKKPEPQPDAEYYAELLNRVEQAYSDLIDALEGTKTNGTTSTHKEVYGVYKLYESITLLVYPEQ